MLVKRRALGRLRGPEDGSANHGRQESKTNERAEIDEQTRDLSEMNADEIAKGAERAELR